MKKKSSALVLIFVVLFVSVQTLNLNRVIKSSGLSLNYLNLNGAWNLINSNQSISGFFLKNKFSLFFFFKI